MTDIVKINASDYGLEESKAAEIKAMFSPMLLKMEELEGEYNGIIKEEISPELVVKAKALRMKYVRVRTGTAEIHKELKAFYLKGGRFVDAFRNTQEFASGEKEKTLKAIEDHFENIEKERVEKLRTERLEAIKKYTDIEPVGLGYMAQDVFDNLLTGFKVAYDARIAAEKKAEEDRIAREKAEAEERERQRLENIRLKAEAEAREKEMAAEREKARKEQEAKDAELRKQKEEADRKQKELQDKLRKEAEAREKAENEIRLKKEAEERQHKAEEKARKDAEKKARLAPDKDKLLLFMQLINDLPRPEVKSIEAADIAAKANIMLVQAANFIKDNANKL